MSKRNCNFCGNWEGAAWNSEDDDGNGKTVRTKPSKFRQKTHDDGTAMGTTGKS